MSYLYAFGLHRLLPVALLAGLTRPAAAQILPDTLRPAATQVGLPADSGAAPLRLQRQEPDVWKLGLNNFLVGSGTLGPGTYYTRYGVHLAYERRLPSPAWSVQAELSPALVHTRSEAGGELRRHLSLRAQVAGRYYHNLERRLRQGHRGGNFAGNYVAVALGAGLGREARDSPFYYFAPDSRLVKADAALLYGVQRRLGRYGFVDVTAGISSLLSAARPALALNTNVRLGLALGASARPPYVRRPRLAAEDEALRPRAYVGVQSGAYRYRVHYSSQNPYGAAAIPFGNGYGSYGQDVKYTPNVYAGYYVASRLAVQAGVQRLASEAQVGIIDRGNGVLSYNNQVAERALALPLLLRYSLSRSFLRRLQFDALGGVVPLWSSVRYRGERLFSSTPEYYGFARRTFGMHATVGLDAAYGVGRRRRVQATAEIVANRSLSARVEDSEAWQPGASIGLRYRFGYR